MGEKVYPIDVRYPHPGCDNDTLRRSGPWSNYVCSDCKFAQKHGNIIRCPHCRTYTLLRSSSDSDHVCSSCSFVVLNEETVKAAIEKHFHQEFLTKTRSKRGADLILESIQPGRRWIIEAKGEMLDSSSRLNEIQRGLGQLLQHIRDPEKQNATVMYGLALPDTPDYWRYLKNHDDWLWVRQTLQLHWLLVNKHDKSVRNIGPNEYI